MDNKIATLDCIDSWSEEGVETEIIVPFRQDNRLHFDEVGSPSLLEMKLNYRRDLG